MIKKSLEDLQYLNASPSPSVPPHFSLSNRLGRLVNAVLCPRCLSHILYFIFIPRNYLLYIFGSINKNVFYFNISMERIKRNRNININTNRASQKVLKSINLNVSHLQHLCYSHHKHNIFVFSIFTSCPVCLTLISGN